MSKFFNLKRSVTLVLISNKEDSQRKTDLIVLLHAALSGRTYEDFAQNKHPPTPDNSSSPLSRYRVEAKDNLVVNLIDTPGLDSGGTQTDAITQAVATLSTIDAFVVVLDQSKPKLGDGIERILSELSAAFPRPIEKNVVFLFTSPDYEAGADTLKLNSPPSWIDERQVFGKPVPDMVGIRNQLRSRFSSGEFLERLEHCFKRSLIRLESLWAYIDSISVQAYEMKHLYLRAAGIESQIYQTMASDPALEDGKAMGRLTTLVKEYQLISASPDFITHVELMTELLRTARKNPALEASIGELEKARARLQALKNENDKYLKWYIASEAF
ncbi:hypothetical protein FRC09_012954 [Ceratobasidium sp. 395]|nr:hypothetical protein FRC09_012954 [Ceratobasidium sp. 395]